MCQSGNGIVTTDGLAPRTTDPCAYVALARLSASSDGACALARYNRVLLHAARGLAGHELAVGSRDNGREVNQGGAGGENDVKWQ